MWWSSLVALSCCLILGLRCIVIVLCFQTFLFPYTANLFPIEFRCLSWWMWVRTFVDHVERLYRWSLFLTLFRWFMCVAELLLLYISGLAPISYSYCLLKWPLAAYWAKVKNWLATYESVKEVMNFVPI